MVKVTHLRCNDEKNVLGIMHPVFSWWLESDERNVKQFRYHIQTALDPEFEEVIWDQTKHTDETTGIVYRGPKLESKTRYYVRVQVWTTVECLTDWSEILFFETPLLESEEWKAQWIRPVVTEKNSSKGYRRPYIAEKSFQLHGEVKRARMYITCLGVYQAQLNGKRIGNDYFRPGFTDYNYRLQYQTYDVEELLEKENVLEVTVAEGWFSGYLGWEERKDIYGTQNGLLIQLEIEYKDGTRDIVKTDESWIQKFGELLYADFYNGESYDYREKEIVCGNMKRFSYPKTTLVPQQGPSVRAVRELKPQKLFRDPDGALILDMGQNMVGWLKFKNEHVTDGKVKLSHAEVLDKDGRFYKENLRKAEAEDTYVLEANDGRWYEPHFTFHGFRYVKLEGFTEKAKLSDFVGIVLSADMEQTGEFSTGNLRINQLQSNILWGQRGNFVDIPTDCPQRNERLGWTADAQIIFPTAVFDYGMNHFARKWLKDLTAGQMEQEGAVPYVIPDILKGVFSDGKSNTTAAWGDAAVICPWVLYEAYGDKGILSEQYESMKAWIDYVRREGDDEYLWDTGVQLGDWLGLDSEEDSYYGATDGCLVATAYYAYSTRLFAKTAKLLGKMSDFREYTELYEKIQNRFYERFVGENVRMTSDTQTAYILPLQFGLLKQEDEKAAAEHLVRLLHKNNDHLNTGFLGTPYICQVLTDSGYTDLAYKLLFHSDFPSWLYQVDHGATTMWEHWDSQKVDGTFWSTEMNSFNHYAYGSIGAWMYRTIGGIGCKDPGYKKSVIAPKPDARIGFSKCTLASPHGNVQCIWELDGMNFKITAVVPANTRALILLPKPADAEALCRQIDEVTGGTAVYTQGAVPEQTDRLYGVEFKVAKSLSETEVKVHQETVFEIGSGTYSFTYELN